MIIQKEIKTVVYQREAFKNFNQINLQSFFLLTQPQIDALLRQ